MRFKQLENYLKLVRMKLVQNQKNIHTIDNIKKTPFTELHTRYEWKQTNCSYSLIEEQVAYRQ